MPEGPEVKRTVDNLLKFIKKNNKLKEITINSGRYTKKKFKQQDKLLEDLPLEVTDIKCKGKFIYFCLSNGKYIFNTLGMSGTWTTEQIKHNNLSFIFDKKIIHFNDVRNFGTFMYQTQKDLDKKLKCLGVDIIEDYKNIDEFKKRLDRKRSNALISTTLLDQKVSAGCGNYLRAEVLYHSKVSPFKKLSELTEDNINNIWYNMTRIAWIFYNINKALKKNIINKKDFLYKNYIDGINYKNYIYYTNFSVYFQDKDKNNKLVVREKIGDRTIHWVPQVQNK